MATPPCIANMLKLIGIEIFLDLVSIWLKTTEYRVTDTKFERGEEICWNGIHNHCRKERHSKFESNKGPSDCHENREQL